MGQRGLHPDFDVKGDLSYFLLIALGLPATSLTENIYILACGIAVDLLFIRQISCSFS